MRKTIATLLAGAALIGISGTAAARVDVGISLGFPAPVYVAPPPPVVYVPPRPVYVAPPAPVYYAPAPVYYGPPAVIYRGGRGWGHRHHHRGHWR
ncbi:MAG TPA: virulence factor [Burkholderiales bacterium]|nr:virulence factor [Burkholderiales bacterium]